MQTNPRNISFGWSLETITAAWKNLGFLFYWFCLAGIFHSCSQEENNSGLETQRNVDVRTEAVKMEVRSRMFLRIKGLTNHKNQLLVFLKYTKKNFVLRSKSRLFLRTARFERRGQHLSAGVPLWSTITHASKSFLKLPIAGYRTDLHTAQFLNKVEEICTVNVTWCSEDFNFIWPGSLKKLIGFWHQKQEVNREQANWRMISWRNKYSLS